MQLPLATFAFILLLIATGRLLAWRRVLPARAADTLNLVVLYVNLPAMVLLYASRLTPSRQLLAVAMLPWAQLLVVAALVLLLARALRWPRAVEGALLLTVPLGNTSYLGYPLTRALFGDAALPYAVAYDQFGSFLILSTYGVVVLAVYGHGVRPRPWHILRRVLTFPAFLALLLALAIAPARLPGWLTGMLQPLATALLPMVALAIGLQLKLKPDREHLPALGAGGVLVQQSESPLVHLDLIRSMRAAMRRAGFGACATLPFPQPSYPTGWWSCTLARKGTDDFAGFRAADATARPFTTRYYNAGVHRAALSAPEFLVQAFAGG